MKANPSCRSNPIFHLIVFCACALLCSCIGATRLPVRALRPDGSKLQKKELDLSFLQTGITERGEVEQQLAPIDTGYNNPQLFWARWSESRWGYWWVLGGPCGNCLAADAGRLWRTKNLLVMFDQNGVLSSKETLGDDRIWTALRSRVAEVHAPLDLSEPLRLNLTNADPAAILLHEDTMEFERSFDRHKPNVTVPVANVVRFKHEDSRTGNSVVMTCHSLELSSKTALGKKIKFCAEPSQIGLLFEYLDKVGQPAMRWQ